MASLLLHFSSLGSDLPPLRFGVPTRLQYGGVVMRGEGGENLSDMIQKSGRTNISTVRNLLVPMTPLNVSPCVDPIAAKFGETV